ncbi:hypothetical protein C6N75_10025 [Streptomyces solincola]|uniref:DUF5047 domain-containing protein n=1 Tax=Streptomyces solincola TaxID=2100817 RepID=A0A2S9PYB1_9ACTN|nr:DUF5047 domain-containing protein [Streptomyces solincola]PRH79411.1 hypothetical protein C6N75_10025 [Streptomyces solincola]
MARQTDKFYATLRKSHTIISWVDVISGNLETVRLPTIEGDVGVDRTASIRRKLNLRCVDPTGLLTPRASGEILTPHGTELRPYRGIVYSDGTPPEVCPLGVFRLSRSTVADETSRAPTIQIEAYDRSRTIARDKFQVPYTIAAGTNVLQAIKDIVRRTFPAVQYDSITTLLTTTAPLLYDAGADPWDAVTRLAKSMGCEIYFDVEGRLVVAPPDDINALPAADFTYIEGQGCIMTDLTRVYSDEPGYNGVIVTGESAGDEKPPVRGEAWDMEPTSPTYRYGGYGEVPTFVTDSLVKTTDEATAAARAVLAQYLGYTSQLSISAAVNPSFEAGDVVEVVRAQSGVSGLYALDSFNIPLRKDGKQQLTLRQRRVSSG